MQKLTLSQFSGGLQEATAPRDFAEGEWSKLRGFVYDSPTRIESQWPIQTVEKLAGGGTFDGANAVFPITATTGVFLVAIKTDGTIWWCKAPAPTDSSDQARGLVASDLGHTVEWSQLTTTLNYGYDDTNISYPGVEALRSYIDYRFVCGVSLPIADYWTTPTPVFETIVRRLDTAEKYGVVPGVLIHARSQQGGAQQALVCFVDTDDDTVKVIKFPAWRRFYQFDANRDTVTDTDPLWTTPIAKNDDLFWLRVTNVAVNTSNVCTLTLKRLTNATRDIYVNGDYRPAGTAIIEIGDWVMISGVAAGVDGTRRVTGVNVGAKTITFNVPADEITSTSAGGLLRMIGQPFSVDTSDDIPDEYRHQPYYHIDADGATFPCRGIIPRANVGVMWKEILLLGDIEWRTVALDTYYPSDATLNWPTSDNNVGPFPNYMYVSAGEVDRFYPYGVLEASPNGSRILGMHVVRDSLVVITTAGGPEDGVIGIRGNLGEVLTSTFNPAQTTFRKELIRGGIGGVESDALGHRQFSCVWPEMGVAAFVDAGGGVWYTNGASCQRLDVTGPQAPNRAAAADHVAAAGRHLFVWRDSRLLVFSMLAGGNEGAWSEMVPPCTIIKSMVGTSTEVYFVNNLGNVQRIALSGPQAEHGVINGNLNGASLDWDVTPELVVATPTMDFGDEHTRKNWHRIGVTFSTESSCTLESIECQASGALNVKGNTPYYQHYLSRAYDSTDDELHELITPTGLGPHPVMSATFTFTGHVLLESVSVWTTGGTAKRGED